jgi:RNA polymerase sigma-70 factor (ECF subfamily)
MIRAWCFKWHLQGSDADDVVQDVLVKLLAAIRKFHYDPERSFRAWLKTVTQHALSDFGASRRRHAHQTSASIDEVAASVAAQTDLEQQLEDAFDAELVELAMHRIKKRV